MYARINLIKIKDDKKEQAMSMMTEEIIPSYEGTEGLLSMGAVMCDDTTGLNMSIWTDKASSDATESNLQSNIEKGAEILDGAPEIYRGDLSPNKEPNWAPRTKITKPYPTVLPQPGSLPLSTDKSDSP